MRTLFKLVPDPDKNSQHMRHRPIKTPEKMSNINGGIFT
jgi:hypothetical protein